MEICGNSELPIAMVPCLHQSNVHIKGEKLSLNGMTNAVSVYNIGSITLYSSVVSSKLVSTISCMDYIYQIRYICILNVYVLFMQYFLNSRCVTELCNT